MEFKKSILFIVILFVMMLFLVSCAQKELSDEDLEAAMAQAGEQEKGAIAGQASGKYSAVGNIVYTSCSDTENNKDYFKKGSITVKYTIKSLLRRSSENTYHSVDRCSGNTLIEYYCYNDQKTPKSETKTCENGCIDGACVSSVCGNGKKEAGEECDDGNTANDDDCSSTCKLEICGDNIIQTKEECDDGNQINTDNCLDSCKSAKCGDKFVQQNVEECDDENSINNDSCTNQCKLPICGDNIKQINEECDDGNQIIGDGCSLTCSKELDTDKDSIFDPVDNCPTFYNPDQEIVWITPTGGTASASSYYTAYFHSLHYGEATDISGNLPKYVFDTYIEDGWWSRNIKDSTPQIPAWLEYDFGKGNEKVIKGYSILTYEQETPLDFNEGMNPKSWTFEGFNNNWLGLDTVSDGNLTMMTDKEINVKKYTKMFYFNNDVAYQKYRIMITSSENELSTRISEMKFLVCE